MAVGTCHRPLSGITGHSYCPFKSIVWLSCIVSYRHYLRSKAIVDCYLGCRNLSPPIIMDNRSFVLSLAPTVDAVQHCCYLVFSARKSIAYELITPGYTCCARLSDLVFAGGCVRTGAIRGPALSAPSSCQLLLCLGISIMISRVRLWPGGGILLAVESGPIWAVRRRNLPYLSCEAL